MKNSSRVKMLLVVAGCAVLAIGINLCERSRNLETTNSIETAEVQRVRKGLTRLLGNPPEKIAYGWICDTNTNLDKDDVWFDKDDKVYRIGPWKINLATKKVLLSGPNGQMTASYSLSGKDAEFSDIEVVRVMRDPN
jgi:hypothetical protein